MTVQVDFEPIGRRIACEVGATLLDAAQQAGVMLTAICGGEGSCGRCIVRVMSGEVSPPNSTEETELGEVDVWAGWRLACQTEVASDVRVHVPPESLVTAQRTQTEGQALAVENAPAVRAVDLRLAPPAIHDLRSDAARIRDALDLPGLPFDVNALRRLPANLREWKWNAAVFVHPSGVVGVRPSGTAPLGFAVDIGTTKLAAYLVNLNSGETLASEGAMNPQIAYGEDVMARISHAVSHADGAGQLRTAIVEALNELARELCRKTGRDVADIADAVIVGNTAMHHLFLGLPVNQLGLAPYVPAESAALDVKARDVGLKFAPGAHVHILPNIAGFVGADHVAMLLATGMTLDSAQGVVLGMDIGTNTEVSLIVQGRHLSCSTASGPAFEGAHIRFGMRAAPGAIEEVVIRDGRVLFKTVGNEPPVGLCGSGILDLIAQMHRAGIINARGAMNSGPRVRRGEHGPEFIVVPGDENGGREIVFGRSDVSEIQLAKGAMRAGVNILLRRAGITEAEIDQVIIAGAFGTYLDVQSGLDIGMIPRVDRHRFKQVGNAAGAGARMALLSMAQRERAARIAQQVEYVELTAEGNFQSEFARALVLE
jgi:uncharacterized 2Fe-2S/4Fe-4S cluster protein (DUF4445 family)